MRLIDADAMIDIYGDWYTEEGPEEGFVGTLEGVVDMMPTIWPSTNKAPEVDAIPVDWIVNFKNSFKAGALMDPREVIKFMLELWEGDSDAEIQNDKN